MSSTRKPYTPRHPNPANPTTPHYPTILYPTKATLPFHNLSCPTYHTYHSHVGLVLQNSFLQRQKTIAFPKSIDRIRMCDFYPKKLAWMDAVTLRGSHPAPGFAVIEKLMMSDYRATTVASAILSEVDGISKKANPDEKVDLSQKFKKFTNKAVNSKTSKSSNTVHPMECDERHP